MIPKSRERYVKDVCSFGELFDVMEITRDSRSDITYDLINELDFVLSRHKKSEVHRLFVYLHEFVDKRAAEVSNAEKTGLYKKITEQNEELETAKRHNEKRGLEIKTLQDKLHVLNAREERYLGIVKEIFDD